ncbi:MAG TPA: hypothetical protein VH640_17400 [Bryobacteraceae bacterium]|jgi:hypothetical protein
MNVATGDAKRLKIHLRAAEVLADGVVVELAYLLVDDERPLFLGWKSMPETHRTPQFSNHKKRS